MSSSSSLDSESLSATFKKYYRYLLPTSNSLIISSCSCPNSVSSYISYPVFVANLLGYFHCRSRHWLSTFSIQQKANTHLFGSLFFFIQFFFCFYVYNFWIG